MCIRDRYVLYPISVRAGIDLRNRYDAKGGFNAVVLKIRLPDGRIYGQNGKVDYVAPTVATNTDTITVRGVIPNPVRPGASPGEPPLSSRRCSTGRTGRGRRVAAAVFKSYLRNYSLSFSYK